MKLKSRLLRIFFTFLLGCFFFQTLKSQVPSTAKQIDSLYVAVKKYLPVYPDSAMAWGHRMITSATELGYTVGIAKGKETIARAAIHKGADSTSLKLAFDAFNFAKQANADSVLLDAINNLGAGYYFNKRIDKTYEFNTLGRRYAEEFGNWEKTMFFSMNAASIMADLGEFEKAVSFYEKSLVLLEDHPDTYFNTLINLEIANIYLVKKDTILAQDFLDKARTTISPDTNMFLVIQSFLIEANIEFLKSNFEDASLLLNKAEIQLEKAKYPRHLVNYRIARARIAYEKGDLNLARTHLSVALPLAKKLNYQDGVLQQLKIRYDIELQQGNYEQANTNLVTYHALKDSLKYDENQYKVKIAEAESNFEKEQELLQLQLEQSNTKQKTIFTIASIVVLFLLSILFLIRINQKKLQQLNGELEKSKLELELKTVRLNEANTMKDKLFSIIGHDFKGPIAGIKNLIDLVTGKDITKEQFSSFLPQMKQKVDHVLFSLNNLLAWGIGQLSGNIINPEKLELHSKVTNAVNLLSTSISDKNIQIKNTVNPELEVWVDPNHIEIVIRNLLSNAIKFTPENGTISFGSEDLNDHSKFWIQDTGVGMPKNIQTKIFKQKQSVTTFGTNKEKGTGLGLSLCIDMIQLNHGEIWVESEQGKGTTIYFTLPKGTA